MGYYYKGVYYKDVYELLSLSLDDIESTIDETNNKLDETNNKLDETNSKLEEDIGLLLNRMCDILFELRKHNALISQMVQKENNKKLPQDLKTHIKKSILIEKTSYSCIVKFAKELSQLADTNLHIAEKQDFGQYDFVSKILCSNKGDYILINLNFISQNAIEDLLNVLKKEDYFLLKLGDIKTEVPLKEVYIIGFVEMKEMLPKELVGLFDEVLPE